MNGYYESDEHVRWRWEQRCKRAEEIIKAKEAESKQANANNVEG
jgi:hypothetical protein